MIEFTFTHEIIGTGEKGTEDLFFPNETLAQIWADKQNELQTAYRIVNVSPSKNHYNEHKYEYE